jgi:hypothetical protein
MKKVSNYIFACILTLAYAASVVGVSMHYCRCSQGDMAVLEAMRPCTCGHMEHEPAGDGCCANDTQQEQTCQHAATGDECCDTVVATLQADQEVASSFSKIFTDFSTHISLYQPAFTIAAAGFPDGKATQYGKTPPLPYLGRARLSLIAQWRL